MFIEKHNCVDCLDKFEVFEQNECIEKLIYGTELEFKYINFKKIDFDESNFTCMDIFKFNIGLVITQLTKHFPQILIKINYGVANRNEMLIKDYEKTIKHDIYIEFEKDGKYFDCGFDFVKKTFCIKNYKYISSLVNLDYYKYFDEDTDNLGNFMNEIIYKILIILCSLDEDEYKLAEIIFSNSNRELENLQEQVEIFKKVINGKKEGKINLIDFYEQIIPIDQETGEDLSLEQFVKLIETNILEEKKIKLIDNKYLSWDDFEWIIMKLDSNISLRVDKYKMVYVQGTNTLLSALKTIIDLIKQINKTKKYIPQYIDNFLSNDLINYSNKELLENVYQKLSDYFLNNLINQII